MIWSRRKSLPIAIATTKNNEAEMRSTERLLGGSIERIDGQAPGSNQGDIVPER
jgi:hypothetical protein